jgi:hypothetical protein
MQKISTKKKGGEIEMEQTVLTAAYELQVQATLT